MTWTSISPPEIVSDLIDQERFANSKIIQNSFVHRSYLNENQNFDLSSNERLEFLGDAVLQFLVSQFLYKTYDENEGRLTNYRSSLVNTETLAGLSRELDLGKYLVMARGEEATGGRNRDYILANTFEAFLGGMYLECGLDSCTKLLERLLFPKLEGIISEKRFKDYKSVFQEKAQEILGFTPTYELAKEWGPDHDKNFTVSAVVNNVTYGEGIGKSKQRAEQNAAQEALKSLCQQE